MKPPQLRHLAVFALAAATLAGCATPPAGQPSDSPSASRDTPAPSITMPSSPVSPSSVSAGFKTCLYTANGAAAKPVDPPPTADVPTSGQVTFTMQLTGGEVVLTLDRAGAPCAVNSFASLAAQGYFDDTDCHRLAPGFVLQCGDPSATGRGGPGYSFADELSGSEKYPRGTVAMANAGPNTNGSQFFIVLADATLQPNYDVLGTVDAASMAVVDAIAAAGVSDPSNPNGSSPLWGAHIDSVTAG